MFLTDLKDTGKTLYFTMHYTDEEEKEYKIKGNTQNLYFNHEELKPCPNCGGTAQIESGEKFINFGFWAKCQSCGKHTNFETEGCAVSFNGTRARHVGICEVIKSIVEQWNCGKIKGNIITSTETRTIFALQKPEKYRYNIEKLYGNCLEGAGLIIPHGAFVKIDRNPSEVTEGDFIHCLCTPGTCGTSYIKQVSKILDDVVIVKTNYKDPSRNFEFVAGEILGLVTDVYDLESGEQIYKRAGGVRV